MPTVANHNASLVMACARIDETGELVVVEVPIVGWIVPDGFAGAYTLGRPIIAARMRGTTVTAVHDSRCGRWWSGSASGPDHSTMCTWMRHEAIQRAPKR